ncbi:hypothetical protein HK104_002106 [Borealophlyctis nickersoniae]|nr:hypothetical protein HK104_002106 [Borealophlyctis nickersoniae]
MITGGLGTQQISLYVEEIDLGEEKPRTVVSGLVKYMKPEELQNRHVVLLCNLKPAKMRGIESAAMVLAATSTDGSTVELITPPADSKPGDRAYFEGYQGTPEPLLNPKKKVWEGVQPGLKTDDELRATFVEAGGKVCVLRTEKGVCGVKSVKGGSIK